MSASGSSLRTLRSLFFIWSGVLGCLVLSCFGYGASSGFSNCGDGVCDVDGVGVSFDVVSISVGNSVTDVGDVATDVVGDAVV